MVLKILAPFATSPIFTNYSISFVSLMTHSSFSGIWYSADALDVVIGEVSCSEISEVVIFYYSMINEILYVVAIIER